MRWPAHPSRHGGAATALLRAAHQETLTATPAFASDGTLWLVAARRGIVVQRSSDHGKTLTAPVAVNRSRIDIDWGPDARPRIVVAPDGEAVVTFAIFQDKRFNGRAYYARSTGGGTLYRAARDGRRHEPALRDGGDRSVRPPVRRLARQAQRRAVDRCGPALRRAALAFAWADGATGFGDTHIAADNTCECCRLGLASPAPGDRP